MSGDEGERGYGFGDYVIDLYLETVEAFACECGRCEALEAAIRRLHEAELGSLALLLMAAYVAQSDGDRGRLEVAYRLLAGNETTRAFLEVAHGKFQARAN